MGLHRMFDKIFICLVLLCTRCLAFTSQLDTLVLYETKENVQFTNFLDTIKENGINIVEKEIDIDSELSLFDANKEILYANVIILPNKAKNLASNIDHNSLLTFSNSGGNIIIVSDDEGTQLDSTLFLNQLGIYPSPKGYKYTDYHNSIDNVNNKVLQFEKVEPLNKYIISNEIDNLSFENSAVSLISNSEYLIPLLQASRTSISFKADKGKDNQISNDSIWHSGNQGYLSVAFQGLNNARVLWLGSGSALSDSNFNKDFVNDIIQWTFQLKSLIKVSYFNHKRIDEKNGIDLPFVDIDDYYKIKDMSYFEIGLSQFDSITQNWIPYVLDEDDNLQLEFIMLDPYYRLNLQFTETTQTDAVYSTIFQLPDQHGMFTFSVEYNRPGLSYLKVNDVVPVRHLANDEYPRSWEIANSSVYMAGYGVVVVAWLIFVIVFILSGKKSIDSTKKNV